MEYIVIILTIFTATILGLAVQYHNTQREETTRVQEVLKSLPKAADVIRRHESQVQDN